MLDSEAQAIKRVYERLGSSTRVPNIIAINRSKFPALRVLTALRDKEIVALHGDRIIDPRWVWVDFLGQRAAFPTGVFLIAAAARVPVVLTFGFKQGPRRYRFVAEAPRQIVLPHEGREEALEGHARWYASRLEEYVRQYPYQWFNFYDFWAEPQVELEVED
jgi:predicted LPLAT superfamily acyltransferase